MPIWYAFFNIDNASKNSSIMTTQNITSSGLSKLSNMNPIVIYDGIMEMIFQEESKTSEKVVKQRNMFAIIGNTYEKFKKLLRISK
ncbi:hypothetical protein CAPN001_03120 [Capnocytophaga stomatis]|uniref:Uncharacterized protein n=2 Tax=Capnocytophaga stomatis TaxID=1848904 RepID=A0A250FV44_9FLAO|nr:hypothetical protein CGC58_03885 [Capnocytophaga stomatis]GIJ94512.1 hypothetical protein CAPN002_17300 [Capnocytophaga stomatis]GIJ95743.1 hypothetical protein CAPN001_03120 [Capnocytophaga stomatis]GIM48877.1 hypothetical protein CAPN003_03290 [Capnocytophaga stomatis]